LLSKLTRVNAKVGYLFAETTQISVFSDLLIEKPQVERLDKMLEFGILWQPLER